MSELARGRGGRHDVRRTTPTPESGDCDTGTAASTGSLVRVPIWARGPGSMADHPLDSAGDPLDAGVRREMEARLATDLGAVRVHTGTEAGEAARSLGARAYTVGADIVFGAGQYAPSTPVGRYLLAHELAHVVQQGPGTAPPRSGPGPAAAEREANAVARSAAGAGHVQPPVAVRRDPAAAGHVQRFDSFEHVQLGDTAAGGPTGYLLLDAHARDLPQHATPTAGWPPDWIARYNKGSADQRRAITQGLTYGEILALSGDMYADIDPQTLATSVAGTMQRINTASLVEIYDLIPILHSRSATGEFEIASTNRIETATGGRYLSLAAQNVSHFSNVGDGHNNIGTWREGHKAALTLAATGQANAAWAMNAAADHFLTDAFAAGHLRPDRVREVHSTVPGLGSVKSKIWHDLDNEFGVAVHNRRGDRWLAYGDDHLNHVQNMVQKSFEARAPDIQGAFGALAGRQPIPGMVPPSPLMEGDGVRIAREAVEASKADIQRALNARKVPSGPFTAEQLVPIVDNWTEDRWGKDDFAAEIGQLAWSELPGQLAVNGDTRAREWIARQPEGALRDMPLDERVRMVQRLLSGAIGSDDLDGVERLYRASPAQQPALRKVIESMIRGREFGRLRTLLGRP
ncbi:DUF4157 domain-containing protein [Streptomyces sp. NPDC002677]|uniref:eCIS core domain-containing protein n=1 Tax=Streptomyces sp. NPDC002677 TaxID=3154774 RepID=UPI003316D20F